VDPTSRTYTGMNAVVPPVRAGPPSLAQFTHIVKCGTTGLPLPSGVIQNHSRPNPATGTSEMSAAKRPFAACGKLCDRRPAFTDCWERA